LQTLFLNGSLPKSIRDQLGRRIEDGEEGKELVKWLNGLPEVQEILEKQFGGRPVTEQNLSVEVQKGLPAGTLGRKSVVGESKPASVGANPSESDLIRPNPTSDLSLAGGLVLLC
jgi:hypothetical protein